MAMTLKAKVSFDVTAVISKEEIKELVRNARIGLARRHGEEISNRMKHEVTLAKELVDAHDAENRELLEYSIRKIMTRSLRMSVKETILTEVGVEFRISLVTVTNKE